MKASVTFITRGRCPLCEAALPLVERLARRAGRTVTIVDVDAAGLGHQYGDRVPVVLGPDDEEILSGRFDDRAVRRALRRLGR